MAQEHAQQAMAAAEQSRILLARAENEILRLETDNERLQRQVSFRILLLFFTPLIIRR